MRTEESRTTKRGRWSMAERARLRELYGLRDDGSIARELKRPVARVVAMAKTLFPPEVRKSGPWTANETLELKRYLGASSAEVIARILGRSVDEVQAQILDLGRVQHGDSWSRAEVGEFKRIHGSRSDEDLSRIFGRSTDAVHRLALEHGLSKDKAFLRRLRGDASTRMPRWTADELAILRDCYPGQSNLEIAKRLGRSVKSVVSKAHHLRLKKSSDRLEEMGRANVMARYEAE